MVKEAINLLPQYYFSSLKNVENLEFENYVRYNLNIDEENKMEVITAFSYYEALNHEERNVAKKSIVELQVKDLLKFIAENNGKLFIHIELLFDKGKPVIIWLKNQLIRGLAMIITFDEMIKKGKKYES